MRTVTVPVIASPEDLHWATERVNTLWGAAVGTAAGDELDALIAVIEAYEREHSAIPAPSPVDAVRFLMDQKDLTQRDLLPAFGSASRVSQFLSGKRPLSKAQIVKLHQVFGIPYESLLT